MMTDQERADDIRKKLRELHSALVDAKLARLVIHAQFNSLGYTGFDPNRVDLLSITRTINV